MAWDHGFDVAFSPRSVAVVGASSQLMRDGTRWGGGSNFVNSLKEAGFAGRIYPVNPKAEEILGLRAYPRVSAIPEPVDFVIVAVPREEVPGVLEDCARANAKNIHVFTAGFEETGDEEGIRLGRQVAEIARRHGLRMTGPNGMGLYVPASRLVPWGDRGRGPGPVAVLSQSGGHASQILGLAHEMGVRFSKVVSLGNSYVLEAADFLEYLAGDTETRLVGMYLEGARSGNRLLRLVRQINPEKPVVVYKGGLTESGARAASSHTGSLAGEEGIWAAFYRQTGAVRADSVEELVDALLAFLYLWPPRGRRVAVIGGGGGSSVAAADVCAREGLEVPWVGEETRRALREFVPIAGSSVRNPMDTGIVLRDPTLLARAVDIIARDEVIDAIIISLNLDMFVAGGGGQRGEEALGYLRRYVQENPYGKPLLGVVTAWSPAWQMGGDMQRTRARLQQELLAAGIPVFPSQLRASRALSRFIGYHEAMAGQGFSTGGREPLYRLLAGAAAG